MTTLPIKINDVDVLTFDITNQDVLVGSLKLSTTTAQNTPGLCTTADCYNCVEINCTQVQCVQSKCNQVKCNQVKCKNSYDSNCYNHCRDACNDGDCGNDN